MGTVMRSAQKTLYYGQAAAAVTLICQRGLSACAIALQSQMSHHNRQGYTYYASTSGGGFASCRQAWHVALQQQQTGFPQQQLLQQQRWQPLRQFSSRPHRPLTNASMPAELTSLIEQSSINKAVRPDPPLLETRPMRFESRRAGVIAIKAGMMQDWDEYGARVPLTVLWIDDCMVSSMVSDL